MNRKEMTEEQAWEAALSILRDYPENYAEETKIYANTYWGLVNAFEQSKKSRDTAHKTATDDYNNCLAGK